MIATSAFVLLVVSLIVQIVHFFRTKKAPDTVSPWLSLVAGALLLIEIIRRSVAIQFIALTGLFESLVFLACLLSLLTFAMHFFRWSAENRILPFGATIIAIIFLALASSPIAPSEVKPPVPALQSGWLILHVSFTFVGEAFFAVGFVSAILQLLTKDKDKSKSYDRTTYTSIAVGYPIFTAGALIFGAIWAEKAWGIWWSWDPKETWALITWLTYTAYLHLRLVRKNTSKLVPALVIIGFFVAMFTFLGVNFLMTGLHSYA